MKIILAGLLASFLTFPCIAFSQDATTFIPRTYWGISLTPHVLAKTKFTGNTAKYQVSSSPQLGGEVLIDYHYNFAKDLSLIFSVGGVAVGYNFKFYIDKDYFSPPTEVDIYDSHNTARDINFNLKGQVELQKYFRKGQNKSWIIAAGGSVLYSPLNHEEYSYSVYFSNSEIYNYLNRDQVPNNDGKPWLNVHLSAGRQWEFRKRDALQCKLKANYSPVKFLKGTYAFDVGAEPRESGNYSVSGSYIGLSFSYVRSGRR
ncbi:hypothetical protein [Flavihumibacter solisilvae]|uniref:Outer membrane protein beta-barrel domain-containing protein n=1 Tax=Flavihumibacter solisilvae TaxID=1349421 RepID=A0A0C1IES1_9BACT|nr:hypothetical protein [Flavihumibacter solisilvae]KIC92665.1 hypothetical protein OI18_21660 [Flavihumibacter solisilvae]